MVAIVSGIRTGLNLTSAEVLGFRDVIGGDLQGRKGQGVNVNIALGQLVLQDQDDLLVARGNDAPVVRTYNSNGSFNDDNGDGWTSGVGMLRLSGAINAAGSTLQRVEPDGGASTYSYDALNRLTSVVRDGVQIDVRRYDGADRVIQSGPGGNLPVKYAELINQGIPAGQTNGKETRLNRYDANGRLMHQTVLKSDNTLKLDISWDTNETASDLGITFRPAGYDAAGNVVGYTVTNHEAGVINNYTSTLARFDAYQAVNTRGESTKQLPGDSTQQYDANGFLVGIVDSTQPANNRTFVNDASGKALFVNQAGNIQRQLIVNGEVLGLYGAGVDPNTPASGYNNNPNFANVVDFDFGYARISANHPSASPGAYTVRTGDTLQSISQSAYGDSALWYRIAEANGLASNNDLRVGQTLNIPNRVSTINNNSTTFRPYDPSRIEGDKTPSLATPEPPKKKGSVFGKLLMVIVAVVVAYFTGYYYLGTTGTATTAGAGTAMTYSGAAAVEAVTTLDAVWTAGSLAAAGAVGGAAGSIASQIVGVATGAQDSFSWRSVGLSAVSGGLGMGLSGVDFGAGSVGNGMVRSAVGNALTQGIGVATGLQDHFDWKRVAASAAGAGVGGALQPGADVAAGISLFERFATGLGISLVAGTAVALARGGRVVVQQVAVDAFGNALGYSLVDATTGDWTRTVGADPAPAAENAEYTGGIKVSQALYDSFGPNMNVPDRLTRPVADLYADGVPRLDPFQRTYGAQNFERTYSEADALGGVAVYVDPETGAEITPVRPHTIVVGRALPPLPTSPRVIPEPSAGQYVVGTVIEKMDGIRARLDAMGEDPNTPEWLRFAAATARGPGNWIPETVKFFAGAGGYALDPQLRGQVNTAVGNFLRNDPIGTTKYAATRYWDDHSLLEIGADGFNLLAGGLISAPFGKLGNQAFTGVVSTVAEAGETALRWTQRLWDYSFEFPPVKPALYNIAGGVDASAIIPRIRNLRTEAMALAPQGFEVVRISNGSAILRYADDAYYSVPKGKYSLIPELRTIDTMGDVFTRRVQGIADRFDMAIHLTDEQAFRLAATRAVPGRSWLHDKFLSAYKGSWVHDEFASEFRHIPGAADLRYMRVGPDVISSTGIGLKYEITQLTPSLNAIYSHTRKYPGELLRYVTYR